jgi:hypothetical protein
MPFSLVVVPPVESERWSCLGCRPQLRVVLHTDFPKGVAMHPKEVKKLFRPLLTCMCSTLCICVGFEKTLAVKFTRSICSV